MAGNTTIEWTEASWNPVTGCSKISLGCENCYAERMANRLKAMSNKRYRNGFSVTIHEDVLDVPFKWKKPRTIFVNSMSDLFHEEIPLEFIKRVFRVMRDNPQHTFQVLTKRSERLRNLAGSLPWPSNIWMGVTVESNDYTFRITDLIDVGAQVQFVSFEPLLGPIDVSMIKGVNWVIVGGESGPKARPLQKEWALDILNTCISKGVPFFFKQWGGTRKISTGRILEGKIWNEIPDMHRQIS